MSELKTTWERAKKCEISVLKNTYTIKIVLMNYKKWGLR